jgi:hypothetical protein
VVVAATAATAVAVGDGEVGVEEVADETEVLATFDDALDEEDDDDDDDDDETV